MLIRGDLLFADRHPASGHRPLLRGRGDGAGRNNRLLLHHVSLHSVIDFILLIEGVYRGLMGIKGEFNGF